MLKRFIFLLSFFLVVSSTVAFVYTDLLLKQSTLINLVHDIRKTAQIIIDVPANVRLDIDHWLNRHIFLSNISKENMLLKETIYELKFRLHTLNLLKEENRRLKKLLSFRNSTKLNLKPTNIVGKELDLWRRTYWISVGEKDNIKEGMAVITPEGLAGIVLLVNSCTSSFIPITDKRVSLDGEIKKNGIHALIQGNGYDALQFLYIPKDTDIFPGDQIVSTGLEEIFPKGWPIGSVKNVKRQQNSIFLEASVKPAISVYSLKEVFVVLGKQ